MSEYLLAIDQGTTSSRAIIFTRHGDIVSQHQIDINQYYPTEGWVEQEPEQLCWHLRSAKRDVWQAYEHLGRTDGPVLRGSFWREIAFDPSDGSQKTARVQDRGTVP